MKFSTSSLPFSVLPFYQLNGGENSNKPRWGIMRWKSLSLTKLGESGGLYMNKKYIFILLDHWNYRGCLLRELTLFTLSNTVGQIPFLRYCQHRHTYILLNSPYIPDHLNRSSAHSQEALGLTRNTCIRSRGSSFPKISHGFYHTKSMIVNI